MTWFNRKNNAKTTLTEDIAISETAWDVADATKLHATPNFLVTCWDKSTYPSPKDDPNMEIGLVTNIVGNTLTVTKNQESTGDNAHSSGDAVEMLITAGSIDQLEPAVNETPAGASNGANTDFTLANTPVDTSSVMVFLDGQLQTYTDDYTIAGAIITFTLAPETGQKIRATYWFS